MGSDHHSIWGETHSHNLYIAGREAKSLNPPFGGAPNGKKLGEESPQ